MGERAVLTHLITSQHVLPLMLERPGGLTVEVTDGVGSHYRGNLAFDLVKTAVNRLAFAQAEELRPHGLTALAISPGLLRSEAMLDGFGVTETTWRDAAADPHVHRRSRQVLTSWDLAEEYELHDIDRKPSALGPTLHRP